MNASEGDRWKRNSFEVGQRMSSGKAPVDQGHGFGSAGEAVDKHRALVESMHAIEVEDLLHAFFIDSFRSMQNERQIGSALCEFARKMLAQARASVPSQTLRQRGPGTRGPLTPG